MADGPQPPSDVLRLEAALQRGRIRARDEFILQNIVQDALRELGIEHEREKRMSPRDRPDFFLSASRWIVEVKLRYPQGQTETQIYRYAGLPDVLGVLLVSVKDTAFPAQILDKPIRTLSLWKQAMA